MSFLHILAIATVLFLCWVWPRKVVITRIVDGDSLEVRRGKRRIRVRIAHLDAPEFKQPGGRASLRHLESVVEGKTIRICRGREDIYGRTVARILVGFTPIHWSMIRAGHAWPDSFLGHIISVPARLARRGLWNDRQRLHPSHWRRLNADRHPGVMLP